MNTLDCRVNIQLYDSLVSMGYTKGAAAESLKQANNDLQIALQVSSMTLDCCDGSNSVINTTFTPSLLFTWASM